MTEVPIKPTENADTFDAAFALLAKEDTNGDAPAPAPAPAAVDPAAAAAGEPAGDAAATAQAAAAAAAGEGDAAATGADAGTDGGTPPAAGAEGDGALADGDKGAAPANEDLLARLADLVRQPPTATQPAATTQQIQTTEQPVEIYTAEEKEALTSYEKDWPDVARAESLKRRAEYTQLVDFVFGSIAKELAPVLEMVQALGTRTHMQDLHAAVPDYEVTRDQVITWADAQPSYLKAAYQQVIQHGTVDEVADLIKRYKQETGAPAAAPAPKAPAAAPTARKTENELPAPAKQAAAALAPVGSKRTAVVQATNPDDFDGAFNEFAKAI